MLMHGLLLGLSMRRLLIELTAKIGHIQNWTVIVVVLQSVRNRAHGGLQNNQELYDSNFLQVLYRSFKKRGRSLGPTEMLRRCRDSSMVKVEIGRFRRVYIGIAGGEIPYRSIDGIRRYHKSFERIRASVIVRQLVHRKIL